MLHTINRGNNIIIYIYQLKGLSQFVLFCD